MTKQQIFNNTKVSNFKASTELSKSSPPHVVVQEVDYAYNGNGRYPYQIIPKGFLDYQDKED
jgi:hypothetical protein